MELFQMCHQFIIMLQRFSESESRIENDIFHSQVAKLLHFTSEIQENVFNQVIIRRLFLHTLGSSLHMHHNIGHSQVGNCLKHPMVHFTGSYVINNSNSIIFHTFFYCEYESLRDFYAQLGGSGLTCKDGEDQDRHLIDMPHAAFACLPDEALEAFNRKYGHLNLRFMMVGAVREGSWHCYDIVREGIDKGMGLADLCETVGLTLADAVSAGDSANDVGMLKAAGLGCCMANGSDDAREAADRIIGDVREDGLAALIEELWLNGPRAEPSGHELGSPWGQMEAAEEKQ